jgi:PAS domain S-box-containing protein
MQRLRGIMLHELLLSSAMEGANIGTWAYEVGSGAVWHSATCGRLLGIHPQEGRSSFQVLLSRVHPEDRPNVERAVRRTEQARLFAVVFRVGSSADAVRWLCAMGQLDDPDSCRVVGVIHDVSEYRMIENRLLDAHQRLEFHVQNSPLAVIEWDEDFRVMRWSPGAERLFGWSAHEVLRKHPNDWAFVHEDDRPAVDQLIVELLGGLKPRNVSRNRNYTKSGQVIHCDWQNSVLLDDRGRLRSLLSLVVDVTPQLEMDRARATLLERERQYGEQLRTLASAAVQIPAAPSSEAMLRVAGDRAREMCLADRATASLVDEGAGQVVLVKAGGCTRSARHMQAALIGRNGAILGQLVVADPKSGQFSERDEALLVQLGQILAISVENSRLCEAERAARRDAERANEAKDEFLAILSHELRTPLTPMFAWLGVLRRDAVEPGTARRALDTIERNAKTQARIVEDILDTSRIITGRMRLELGPTDLPALVASSVEAARPSADAKNIALALEVKRGAMPVWADGDRLQQVFGNLLSNALKFTATGGHVWVKLRPEGKVAIVEVIDDGQGIAPDLAPFVFDRFRQGDSSAHRAQGGLGLGLAISKHLVELHGGHIEAESEGADRGATFRVVLPVRAALEAGEATRAHA